MIDRLVLGTVQFGLDYGVTNETGKTDAVEVNKILAFCRNAGVRALDTSSMYGSSEKVIGESPASSSFNVVTKARAESPSGVQKQVRESLALLQRSTVYGLLVHNYDVYRSAPEMYRGLLEAKQAGQCERIGFSLYDAEELLNVLAKEEIDLVQVPVNALDKRILPALRAAKQRGVEVHARSPFLQGLLATSSFVVPPHLQALTPARDRFLEWAASKQLTPLAAALALPLSHSDIDRVVLGVNSLQQAEEVVAALAGIDGDLDWPDFGAPEYYLNPANWQK